MKLLYKIILFLFFSIILLTDSITASTVFTSKSTSLSLYLNQSIETPETYYLNINFKLNDGWHIYWKNPGEAGLPLTANLNNTDLSDKIRWPTPLIFKTGDLKSFGFKGMTTLYIPFKFPKDQNAFPFKGKLSWLVCDEECIPESVNIDHTFERPIIKISDSAINSSIQIPTPIPAKINPNQLLISLKDFHIKSTQKEIYFFPHTNNVVDITKAQQYDAQNNQLKVPIKTIRSQEAITGVLAFGNKKILSHYNKTTNGTTNCIRHDFSCVHWGHYSECDAMCIPYSFIKSTTVN